MYIRIVIVIYKRMGLYYLGDYFFQRFYIIRNIIRNMIIPIVIKRSREWGYRRSNEISTKCILYINLHWSPFMRIRTRNEE